MTVYFDKARKQWRYDFELDGRRHVGRCPPNVKSKRAAQVIEDDARHKAKNEPKLPRATDLTFIKVITDLSEAWRLEPQWENKQRYVRELVAFFKPETPIREIDEARIQDYLTFAQQQPVMIWIGGATRRRGDPKADRYWKPHPTGKRRSTSTVNRYTPILRAVFDRAYKTRDPITGARCIDEIPKIADLPEPKRKARPTPDAVITDLFKLLPEYVNDAIRATLYFGFRKGEVFSLQIHNVDFDAGGVRLEHDHVKDDEDAFLPGGRDAMQFLARLVDQAKERGVKHLITYRVKRKDPLDQAAEPWRSVKNPRGCWRRAMKVIEETHGKKWRWHDLRAAFITQVALTSGPIAAQALARHSDFETTQGYIEVADNVTRAAAEKASQRPAFGAIRGGKT